MKAERCASGHSDVMEKIFYNNCAVVIASWIEDNYQGGEAYAYLFKDGYLVIIQDSFGSCSGCDSWEDASDQDAERLIRAMVNSSKIFKNIDEAINYIEKPNESDYYGQYLININNDLKKYNKIYKKITIDEAPLYINDKNKIINFMCNIVLGVIK